MTAKRDASQVAFDVFQQAVGEVPKRAPKQEAAAGQSKGGAKRMATMSADERRELALKAAGARWSKTAPGPLGTGAGKASKGG